MYKTSAIILKKVIYGEADLIITFLGRDEGRLSGIAKNARISHRRFGGALEIGSLVNLQYVTRQVSELVRIEDASVTIPTTGVMQSLSRIGALSRALELALAFLPERQAAPEKFDLLASYLSSIAVKEPTPASMISFELRWLSLSGYQPVLERCVKCGKNVNSGEWVFSLEHGGLYCGSCTSRSDRFIGVPDDVVEAMRVLSKGGDFLLEPSSSRAIRSVLSNYIEYILGRGLAGDFVVNMW